MRRMVTSNPTRHLQSSRAVTSRVLSLLRSNCTVILTPRTRYAAFVREINKHLPMPVVALFRLQTGQLTLAFVHRRQHKRDQTRDVLGRVALVREIDLNQPHRAHLDILQDLILTNRLGWLHDHSHEQNFKGLLAAWIEALGTQELNRKFYKDLFGWFEWAVQTATFPATSRLQPQEHIIRLITRLLFVWFIKEKGLVAAQLFTEATAKTLLQNYRRSGDSYYRAVLQNLFFATLNTELGKRGFSNEDNSTHRNFSRYRYRKELRDPRGLAGPVQPHSVHQWRLV